MNFKLVMMEFTPVQDFWILFLQAWEGRFEVLFIILAGIGVSLMTRKARKIKDPSLLKSYRKILFFRAVFLFVMGGGILTDMAGRYTPLLWYLYFHCTLNCQLDRQEIDRLNGSTTHCFYYIAYLFSMGLLETLGRLLYIKSQFY